MERILKGMHNGEAVAMALDQNIERSRGVFIEWMGLPALSVRSSSYVARETGASVIAGYLTQHGPDSFELVLTEEVKWEAHPDDPEKELLINTQKHSNAIQKFILSRPELWFWLHKRWKNQPEGIPDPYRKKKVCD